jgi:hypothetical protein
MTQNNTTETYTNNKGHITHNEYNTTKEGYSCKGLGGL